MEDGSTTLYDIEFIVHYAREPTMLNAFQKPNPAEIATSFSIFHPQETNNNVFDEYIEICGIV